jgi:hypothetical protein
MAFEATRITEAVWPEALGVGTYAGAEIVAAAIDKASEAKPGYPSAQTIATVLALGGGIVGVAYNWAPGFSKGLLYGAGVGLVLNGARILYDTVTKQPARMRPADFAALIPRKVGALSKEGGGGGLPLGGGLKLREMTLYAPPGEVGTIGAGIGAPVGASRGSL